MRDSDKYILEKVLSRKRYPAATRMELEEALVDIVNHDANPESVLGKAFGKKLEGYGSPVNLTTPDSAVKRRYTSRVRR